MGRRLLFFFGALLVSLGAASQDLMEYTMTDTTVTDCDGYLSDSGGPDESYSINENFEFTISTGGVSIEVEFLENVCIENNLDFLNIYDGEDTNAPLITSITGADFIPPPFNASSGAVTFEFISDGSVSYCGFEIFWNTIAGPPPIPTISVSEIPECESNEVLVDFSYPIGCDWLVTDSISFFGSSEIEVLNATVLCENDSSSQALLQLAQPLDMNCEYQIDMTIGVPDPCDSLWYYNVLTDFLVTSCDIQSFITSGDDELCGGGCTTIEAGVSGCFEHTFVWDNNVPDGPGPHEVCLTESTTYTVVITELATGNTTNESITIDLNDAGIIQESGPLCQSEPAFFMESNIPGGEWFGDAIQDNETGYFIPDSASAGPNIVYYVLSETCADSVIFDVTAIEAGIAEAVCPGQGPFFLQPETPGGVWDGPFVQPDGLFDPSVPGSYEVFYALDGCSDTLIVNIEEITGNFALDTLCQSNFADTIPFSPLGGNWSGPGIVDPFYGIFDPSSVDPGTYDLLYEVVGCDQIFTVTVKETYTGNRVRTSCPEEAPYIPQPDFAPQGGYWEGVGITDEITGEYAPGIVPNDFWTELIYYAPNGCTDTIFYYNRQTEILTEALYFCDGDEFGVLNFETVGRTPFGGIWTGPGITNPWGDRYEFNPTLAGVGEHMLYYETDGCQDSLPVFVYPNSLTAESYSMCNNEPAFLLDPSVPSGGTWSGFGVVDAASGLFDPATAVPNDYYVYWETPAGCTDSVFVSVEEFFQASIGGLDPIYCYSNEDIALDLFPDDGVLTGGTGDGTFNPAIAGEGTHDLVFQWMGNQCMSEASFTVEVYPELVASLNASDEVICPGAGSVLSITAEGGQPDILYTYEWSDGLFPVDEVTIIPESSQYVYVSVYDECSDPFVDSVFIEVLPPIEQLVTTSDTLCFGEEGAFASADVLNVTNYSVEWDGDGASEGQTFFANAGTIVELNITDLDEGCSKDTLILIPSYTPISALFSPNPNEECIGWDSQPFTLIDFSQFAVSGTWDFGNETNEPYVPGQNPQLSYETPGDYVITLSVENEGQCPDTAVRSICILPPTPIFIPDIFSPNGDDLNDMLFVRGDGITEMLFQVYDRWGERVFQTNSVEKGWDGNFRGTQMPGGVYAWVLVARLNDGSAQELSGNVTLIR